CMDPARADLVRALPREFLSLRVRVEHEGPRPLVFPDPFILGKERRIAMEILDLADVVGIEPLNDGAIAQASSSSPILTPWAHSRAHSPSVPSMPRSTSDNGSRRPSLRRSQRLSGSCFSTLAFFDERAH